jgi:hypothetical protein
MYFILIANKTNKQNFNFYLKFTGLVNYATGYARMDYGAAVIFLYVKDIIHFCYALVFMNYFLL